MNPFQRYSLAAGFEILLSNPEVRSALSEEQQLKSTCSKVFPLLTTQQLETILNTLQDQELSTLDLITSMNPPQIRTVLLSKFKSILDIDIQSLHNRVIKLSKMVLHLHALVESNTTQNLSYHVNKACQERHFLTQAMNPINVKLRRFYNLSDAQLSNIINHEKYTLISSVHPRIKAIKQQVNDDTAILLGTGSGSISHKLSSLVSHYEAKDIESRTIPAYETLSEWGIFTSRDCDLYADILGGSEAENSMSFVIKYLENHGINTKADLQAHLKYPITRKLFIEFLLSLSNK